MTDLALSYIENLWSLENPGGNVTAPDLDRLKKQFAYKLWKEEYGDQQKREDSKESDLKGVVSEVYQLIGFYSVFQGVWFQGVVQLASGTSCRASILPIILSVLVSFATIIGVHLKLTKAFDLKKAFFKDKLISKILELKIHQFGIAGLNVNLGTPDRNQDTHRSELRKELEEFHQFKLGLVALLIILSVLFAWLVYAVRRLKNMVNTKIINNTGYVLELKEGNGGTYRSIANLQIKGKSKDFVLKVDLNSTYREYVVLVLPTGVRVFITSDDMIGYDTITVFMDGTKLMWAANPRRQHSSSQPANSSSAVVPKRGTFAGFSDWFRKFFKGDASL